MHHPAIGCINASAQRVVKVKPAKVIAIAPAQLDRHIIMAVPDRCGFQAGPLSVSARAGLLQARHQLKCMAGQLLPLSRHRIRCGASSLSSRVRDASGPTGLAKSPATMQGVKDEWRAKSLSASQQG